MAHMDSLGVDVHVVSTCASFFNYNLAADVTGRMHRECNEEVHQMSVDYPDRFKGFAQIPMQDVAAIPRSEGSTPQPREGSLANSSRA